MALHVGRGCGLRLLSATSVHSSIMIIIACQCWKCWVVHLPVDIVPVSPFSVISLLPLDGGDGAPCGLDVGLSPCLQQGPVAVGCHPCAHDAIGALAHLHVSRLRHSTCDLLRAHAVVSLFVDADPAWRINDLYHPPANILSGPFPRPSPTLSDCLGLRAT